MNEKQNVECGYNTMKEVVERIDKQSGISCILEVHSQTSILEYKAFQTNSELKYKIQDMKNYIESLIKMLVYGI